MKPTLVEEVAVRITPKQLERRDRIEWQNVGLSYTMNPEALHLRRQCIRVDPPWFIETHSIKIKYAVGGIQRKGRRKLFSCECGRGAIFLYLPEGATRFKCKRCHKLMHRAVYKHQNITYKLARGDLKTLERELAKGSVLAVEALAIRLRWEMYGKRTRRSTIRRKQQEMLRQQAHDGVG